MAFEDFLKNNKTTTTNFSDFLKTSKTSVSGFSDFLKTGVKKKDLTTSEGLNAVAQQKGGAVATKAKQILDDAKKGGKKVLMKTLDIVSRPNYAIASGVKNIIDTDPNTTFESGLISGITGRTKNTFSDVFTEAGWNPDTKLEKFGKGAAGFVLDVLLDPTTYITLGSAAGAKVAGKTLTKVGTKALKEGAEKAGQKFGEEFTINALKEMEKTSPELYKAFVDQGGIKFFGKTLISAGRIKGVVDQIPGMSFIDRKTAPVRNALGSLFNRNISAKFGKLPNEFIQLQDKWRDLGKVKTDEALNRVVEIARQNNLTANEAEIITNAIEHRLPLADDRLENARKLLEQGLEKNLADELKAGIKVGDLPNYVPHMLLDNDVKNIPFKPEGVRVSLGAGKERTIKTGIWK